MNNRCYVILRTDLNMPEGKMAVQVGHAVDAIWSQFILNCQKEPQGILAMDFNDWVHNNRRKVVLRIDSEQKLKNLSTKLSDAGYTVLKINDYGLNFFEGLTQTGIVVYPVRDEIKELKRVRCW